MSRETNTRETEAVERLPHGPHGAMNASSGSSSSGSGSDSSSGSGSSSGCSSEDLSSSESTSDSSSSYSSSDSDSSESSSAEPPPRVATPVRPRAEVRKEINMSDIVTTILQIWEKPIEQLPVFGDLPRLAARVFTNDLRDLDNIISVPSLLSVYPDEKDVTCHMIISIAKLLDTPAVVKNFQEVLDRTKQTAKDGKMWIQEVYEAAGTNTKTFRLFKLIHQGVIMSLASQIKVVMLANTQAFTKDVRTPDGWVIVVKITREYIHVSHRRKESSMLPGTSHFEFQWKIGITLDTNLTKVLHISTSTKNFEPNPNMNPQFAEKLRVLLGSMNLEYTNK
eukprot:TRINITY_DN11725_c0_g1_i1.p1 TRINITY_DN11725_c0_g1~~TRINITY_DN11725_c0_g1_i1.p1  ORF type:complete len:337 (+),score=35.43 TRINITY_DN11725_c0_g1_i1:220-1230(+)